jgi:hypothetical protein
MNMLIELVVLLIVAGAIMYVIELLPIDATFKRIAQVILIVAIVVYAIVHLTGYIHA